MAETLLVVEDEPIVAKSIRLACEQAGFTVRVASSGRAALAEAAAWQPDAIVLDLLLPDMSGLEVCRTLRERKSTVPIIMLTALADEIDRVVGLEMGADDYITKPFSVRELLARLRAVLRRSQPVDTDLEELRFGEVLLRPRAREVLVRGQPIHLTSTEFNLLALFASAPGIVFEREAILQRIWGYDSEGESRLLDVHMRRLREKVELDPANPQHLLTVRGVGYRLVC
ncbi:MAG: response regulator transcription factor [Chloroflexota bacterium]